MKIQHLVLIPLLTLACGFALQAAEDENLFPEGAFEMADSDGLPEGWGIPDKNDLPWKAGAIVTLEGEEGGNFARITTVPEYPGFYALSAALPIPEGKSTIRLSARMRTEMEVVPGDWNGFKVHIGFATEAGSGPGIKGFEITDDKVAFSLQDATQEWREMETTVDVPTGAKFVCIKVLVGSMLGRFDVDDVQIYAE